MSLWLRLPVGTSAPFVELANRHGVAVVSGSVLSDGGDADGWIRLTYARPAGISLCSDTYRLRYSENARCSAVRALSARPTFLSSI